MKRERRNRSFIRRPSGGDARTSIVEGRKGQKASNAWWAYIVPKESSPHFSFSSFIEGIAPPCSASAGAALSLGSSSLGSVHARGKPMSEMKMEPFSTLVHSFNYPTLLSIQLEIS